MLDARQAQTIEEVVEGAFLSPRVVDAATLAEFAESLQFLIRRAAEQRELLRGVVDEGESVSATLRDVSAQAGERLRPAVKLLPALDEQMTRAGDLARAAETAATEARRAAEEARAIADAARRASEDAQRTATEATERAERVIENARAATAARDEIAPPRDEAAEAKGEKALAKAKRSLDASARRAEELEGRLESITARASEAVRGAEQACRERLDEASRCASDHLATFGAELGSRANAIVAGAIERLERAAREAATAPIIVQDDETPVEMGIAVDAHGATGAVRAELDELARRAGEITETARAALKSFDEQLASRIDAVAALLKKLASLRAEALNAARAAAKIADADETGALFAGSERPAAYAHAGPRASGSHSNGPGAAESPVAESPEANAPETRTMGTTIEPVPPAPVRETVDERAPVAAPDPPPVAEVKNALQSTPAPETTEPAPLKRVDRRARPSDPLPEGLPGPLRF